MNAKTAKIELAGMSADRYEVYYRGKLLHTEQFDNSNAAGYVNDINAKRAAAAAEKWATDNGFTRVEWVGSENDE